MVKTWTVKVQIRSAQGSLAVGRMLSTWSHAGSVARSVTLGGPFLVCFFISVDAGSALLNRTIGVSAGL